MNFPFYIARRYLLTKKSHHAINIISGISVIGVAVSTAALVCILSVFNGFQGMIANLFTAFDPELKVVAAKGKFMDADADELTRLKADPRIDVCSEVLEDNALLVMPGRQVMATVKGVDDNFIDLIDFDRIKYGDGVFELHADVIDYGVFGVNLLSSLGVGSDFPTPIQVYAPRGGEHIDLNDPSESFNQDELYSPHVAFCVKQGKYDSNYVVTSLRFARRIFERQGKVSAIELKAKPGVNLRTLQADMQTMLGNDYVVKNRYEQQEDTFKIMKIEKFISYIFLTFILMIACFNIIGSLSMLIIDKRDDVVTLRNLGATEKQIRNIFMAEGRMIATLGALMGIALGVLLCWAQQQFGIIKFGQSAGSYIIDSYPVSVEWTDLVLVFVTVIIVGFVSVWYPVRQLSRKLTAALTIMVAGTLMSCSSDNEHFIIKGSFTDMPVGQLYIYNTTSQEMRFDTIYINGGDFTYSGTADELTPFMIVFPNALEQVIFAQNGDEIKYKASAKDLKNYTADGNDENRLMNNFRRDTKELNAVQTQEVARQYIRQNPQSAAAVYLLTRYFIQETSTEADDVAEMIDTVLAVQPQNQFLLAMKNIQSGLERGNIGRTMPDIKIKTNKKETINLKQLDADRTVIVFWASWMPQAYDFFDSFAITTKEYAADKQVEFITISLDTEIYRWESYIREDTTYSRHSCDGLAWESPAVKSLGVSDVPSFIVVDKKHKIVARGNSIDEMENILSK